MKKLFLLVFTVVIPAVAWGFVYETFKAKTQEGVTLTFRVNTESENQYTCQVGDGSKKSDRAYTYDDIKANLQEGGTLTIPAEVYHNGHSYSVEGIANYAFQDCIRMHSIAFESPEQIKYIGSNAFQESSLRSFDLTGTALTSIPSNCCKECAHLTSVSLPAGITVINKEAFDGCPQLTTVNFPSSLITICSNSFSGCTSLASISLPSGLQTIEGFAFANTALTTVTIPTGVTSIAYNPFSGCKDLETITVKKDNTNYNSGLSCNAIIETSTNRLITGCKNTRIPGNVTFIEREAFYNSPITSVSIPMNVSSIGKWAFAGCNQLASFTVYANTPPALADISVFQEAPSVPLYVPYGCGDTYRNADGWKDCFSEIVEMEPIVNIAFADDKVKAICVANWDINGDGELSVAEAADVTDIGQTFKGRSTITSFDELSYFTGLTQLPYRAFRECDHLESIVIPRNVETISVQAFEKCSYLASVRIPKAVSSIGKEAFYKCHALSSVIVEWTEPLALLNSDIFSNSANTTLYVPVGCRAAYEKAEYWKDFKEIVEMPAPSPAIEFADNNVKALCVSNWDTNHDGELSEAEAAAVTSLGEVFNKNADIVSFDELRYFTGLESLEWNTFNDCTKLESIVIPANVKSLTGWVFSNCASLKKIVVDADNTMYDSHDECNAIIETASNKLIVGCETTAIPYGVTTIGRDAFWGRWGMTNMSIPETVNTIGVCAFAYSGLQSIILPKNLVQINGNAFLECNLKTVTANNPVPAEIEDIETFGNCQNTILVVPSGSEAAYRNANVWKEFKAIIADAEATDVSKLANAVYVDAQTGNVGRPFSMDIKLKNESSVRAYSFDLQLPVGITIAKNGDGDYELELSGRHDSHAPTVNYEENSNTYKLAATSRVVGNDGVIMTLKLQVSNDMPIGESIIRILNATYTQDDGDYQSVDMPETFAKLTIGEKTDIQGDANGDGCLTVADAVIIIRFILGENPANFDQNAADMNGDCQVTMTDVILVLDKIRSI